MEGRRRKTRLKSSFSLPSSSASSSSSSSFSLTTPSSSSSSKSFGPFGPFLPLISSPSSSSSSLLSSSPSSSTTLPSSSLLHLSSEATKLPFKSSLPLLLFNNNNNNENYNNKINININNNNNNTNSLSVSKNNAATVSSNIRKLRKRPATTKNNNNLIRLSSNSLNFHHYLIINNAMLLLICLCISWLCYAQESDFALRPFPASLHSTTNRRQDGSSYVAPTIEIGLSSNNILPRHPTSSLLAASSSNNEPNLMPILTAPVPRGSGSNPRPSFQRIRLNNPPLPPPPQSQKPPAALISPPPLPNVANVPRQNIFRQPGPVPSAPATSPFLLPEEFVPVALTESPVPNFQRVIGLQPNNGRLLQTPAVIQTAPPPPPPPPPPPSPQNVVIAPVLPIQSPALPSVQAPQRQSFRRIKPPQHGTWRVKPKNPSIPVGVLPPTVRPTSARIMEESDSNKLSGRGPISAQDEDLSHKPNALDNEDDPGIIDRDRSSFYGNRLSPSETSTYDDNGILAIESLSRSSNQFEPVRTRGVQPLPSPSQVPSVVPTPTIPLTYYTTFTYYTTVVRGPHTAMLSREQVVSSTQLRPIDRNIVTAIEFSDGYIQPEKSTVILGTKTKGQTTTIYNAASRVQVFNDDLYKVIFATSSKMLPPPSLGNTPVMVASQRIVPTRTSTPTVQLESTATMSRQPPTTSKPAGKASVTVRLEQLQNQLKKQLSLLTYYYTLIEGAHTQYSTRVEESTANYNGDLSTLLPSIAPTIDSYGLLKIISPNSVVSLGSRANGEQTTVVNLALNNYIKFNRVKDAQIDIAPTPVAQSPSVALKPTATLLSSSMEPEEDGTIPKSPAETPRLSSSQVDPSSTPTPPLSSTIVSTDSTSRRTNAARRPTRIKLKPIRSKVPSHHTRHSSSKLDSVESATSPIEPSIKDVYSSSLSSESSSSYVLTPTIVDQTPVLSTVDNRIKESSAQELPVTPTQRKKVAFTVRRPGQSGVNRFFSRRPSSQLLYPYSSPVAVMAPSPTTTEPTTIETTSHYSSMAIAPSSVVSSSTVSPTATSLLHQIDTTTSPSPSIVSMPTPLLDNKDVISSSSSFVRQSAPLSPSPVWSSTPPSSRIVNKNRLVVLTRLAGASQKWNPMYNSRVRVSSRRLIKSTNPLMSVAMVDSTMMPIEPTSAYETMIYETTTHTVPFTIGSSVTYTTVEETNTRIVTDSMEMATPSFEDMEPIQATPELSSEQIRVSSQQLSSSFVIVETSDVVTTSTLYSTYTYFATLFNGTQTSITPLEEVKTEYLTLREPVTITRTIIPSVQFTPSAVVPTVTTPEASTISVDSVESIDQDDMTRLITETYSTQTTLTHFITLFSGSHTILSSIEEISPTVMTRTRYVTPYTMLTTTSSSVLGVHSSVIPTVTHSSPQQHIVSSSREPPHSSSTIMPSVSEVKETTSTPTPSPPQTTPGSISYETGPLDGQDIFMLSQFEPNRTTASTPQQQQSSSTTPVLEPGSVIELEDLLEGVQDAGPIGETIKDIVKDIFKDDDTTTIPPMDSSTARTDAATTLPVSPSFATTTTKATPSLNRYPIYSQSQKPSKPHYHDTARDNNVIFSTQSDGDGQSPVQSTRYVTSVEKSIRTLTLTSTKVYYTRDSPLTITSVLTTTLPPITYVSTIIGSKTILGTYNSITPTKTVDNMAGGVRSTLISPTTPISPSSTQATQVQQQQPPQTTTSSASQPTTRPRLYRPKPTEMVTNKAKVASILTAGNQPSTGNNNNRQGGKQPTGAGTSKQPTTSTSPSPTLVRNVTMTMDQLQLCDPACNVTNKEYCRESEPGRYGCECRPGYVRRPSDQLCQEIKNYLVTVRVSKTAESEVAATSAADGELQKYARVARRQVGKADGIAGLQVLSVDHSTRSKGPLVNLTIQIDHKTNNVHDELSKKLEPLGRVEKVVDFDECSSPIHNDCSPRARCINEPGSYSCQCFEPFIDLDRTMPGRLCVTEIKSCDYCHGRGDCWRNNSDTVCRCHPMFIGRRCEINGLLLAILVPIVAILVIIAIVCFFYCSRKLRQRNRRFKNLTAYGPVAVIGGTLDRKAMLETSSESSDPQHRSSHYTQNESNPASARGSMARRQQSQSRRESEPSLDRSLASYSATTAGSHYNSLPHQIVIPRARPTYALHPGQVYMW